MKYYVFSKVLNKVSPPQLADLQQAQATNWGAPQGYRLQVVDATSIPEAIRAARVSGGHECVVIPVKHAKKFHTKAAVELEEKAA